MKSIHQETREKAVNAVLSGKLSGREAASIFGVHWSTIYNWIRIYKCEGRTQAHKCGGRKATFTYEHEVIVHEEIKKQPDITLNELVEKLDNVVKKSCLHKHLQSLGYDYKKNSESKRTRSRRYQA